MSLSRAGRWKVFRLGYALLALNFLLPAASYVVAPGIAIEVMDRVNRLLGGGPWPSAEDSELWHLLAVGNVATLGFMCLLIFWDLRRYRPVLPALVFLKAFSALYALARAAAGGPPAFYGVFLLDGVTTGLIVGLAWLGISALPPVDAKE